LLDLGDISSLGHALSTSAAHSFGRPANGVTVAYGRDRGETGTAAKTGPTIRSVESCIGHNDHVYVYDASRTGNRWTHNGRRFK
jgi:hypothetical protein